MLQELALIEMLIFQTLLVTVNCVDQKAYQDVGKYH